MQGTPGTFRQKLMTALRTSHSPKLEGMWKDQKTKQIERRIATHPFNK